MQAIIRDEGSGKADALENSLCVVAFFLKVQIGSQGSPDPKDAVLVLTHVIASRVKLSPKSTLGSCVIITNYYIVWHHCIG
jgi:hypothetical protein